MVDSAEVLVEFVRCHLDRVQESFEHLRTEEAWHDPNLVQAFRK